jgi:hypothetical protein
MSYFRQTILRPKFTNTYTRCYSLSSKSSAIPAEPVLLCKNCKYLQLGNPDFYVSSDMKKSNLYEKYMYEYAKCLKFGKIDLVTGEIKHDYASITRMDSYKCGYKAIYYEEKENNRQNRNKKYDESPLS